jgi:hypothetical protein
MWNNHKVMRFQDKNTYNGFQRSESEPTLYIKENHQGNILIFFLYVDDFIFTGDFGIEEFKSVMKDEFEMIDLWIMRYFLGIEVHQSKNGIFISLSKYVHEILKIFDMINSKATPTTVIIGLKLSKEDKGSKVDLTLFKRLVGSLMYLTMTRLDIVYGVSLISRFMETPKESHWKVGKGILIYVNGEIDFGIKYSTSEDFKLIGYTNNDCGGSIDVKKSTSRYMFHFGIGMVSWESRKNPIVTHSSVEAEDVAATSTAYQGDWMRIMLKDLL